VRKRKDKKLKKQFKKLLQSQLSEHLNEAELEVTEEKAPETKKEETKKDKGYATYVKKDIKRTVQITAFILFLMISLYFYFGYTHSSSQIARALLRLIGAS